VKNDGTVADPMLKPQATRQMAAPPPPEPAPVPPAAPQR
jgi:hypothetical protein